MAALFAARLLLRACRSGRTALTFAGCPLPPAEPVRSWPRPAHWRGSLIARGEHALLWLYWLTSGYGLRALRAFTSLAVLVAVTAGAFTAWGFKRGSHLDYAGSVQYTLRAATSFLHGPDPNLTGAGPWMELTLRFTGPLLFGLAVLALRSRVKR
ncbi:MAG: hypothetical protein JWN00_5280 [Actinomycetia bacterium]|nr:hypothetical protein [Actinomycetes bacterium]